MFEAYGSVINYFCLLLMVGVAVQLWFSARLFLFASGLFMLIGTYSGVHLVLGGAPWILGLVVALATSLIAGALVAWLISPLAGLYLGLASLAVSEIVRTIAVQVREVSGGPDGFIVSPVLTPPALLIASAVVLAVSWLYQKVYAGQLRTINFDPRVADSLGIKSKAYQLVTLSIGACICGGAAFLYALTSFVVTPSDYGFNILVLSMTVAVIGGRRHWLGPVAGAAIIGIAPQFYRGLSQYTVIMSGLILLVVILFLPDGIVPSIIKLVNRLRGKNTHAALHGESEPRAWSLWLNELFPLRDAPGGSSAPALKLSGVHFEYGGVHALRDVSFEVAPGEVLGVIGPNGAGKSTLLNTISGVTEPSSGTIEYFGKTHKYRGPAALVRAGVMRTFQRGYLVPTLDVIGNLSLGRTGTGRAIGGIELGWAAQRRRRSVAELSIRAMGFQNVSSVLPDSLSLGTGRLVEVVRAVNQAPELLLLDEPTAGMDADEVTIFEQLILDLGQRGVAIVLISHDLDVIQKTCHRVHVLSLGESIADVPAAEMLTNEKIADAYLGRQGSRK